VFIIENTVGLTPHPRKIGGGGGGILADVPREEDMERRQEMRRNLKEKGEDLHSEMNLKG
jgi:hypothetical protein